MSARLGAILHQKCPVCFEGDVHRRGITMNEFCPACGLRFEREQGYFLGAMYVAYAMAVPILLLFTAGFWFLTGKQAGVSFLIAIVVFLPLSPVVYRYSRVVWMHLDQLVDPRPAPDSRPEHPPVS